MRRRDGVNYACLIDCFCRRGERSLPELARESARDSTEKRRRDFLSRSPPTKFLSSTPLPKFYKVNVHPKLYHLSYCTEDSENNIKYLTNSAVLFQLQPSTLHDCAAISSTVGLHTAIFQYLLSFFSRYFFNGVHIQ